MAGRWGLFPAILMLALSVGCGPAETEAPAADAAAAAPDGGGDPTVVDAEHYKVEFENERVRILRITYGAGEESVMHEHPEAVAVYLTDAHVEMGLADGTSEPMHAQAGQAQLHPAGQHLPKNVGEEPIELILVELKSGPTGPPVPDGEDPIAVDPGHYSLVLDNDAVRVLRIAYGAGEESAMHYHPDSVAVFLTDHLVQMTLPDGSTSEVSASAGEHLFIPAGPHLPKNIANTSWELILVELK